ncbi:MAG: hypothetical protein CVT88_03070 [Candidatus Altiarchaeales archaeon HGW-Altiarchaeales-1]|nr:MAG: hypothetical protein CVT88_03070 [Candidatus Altiarchaeales archaeon HGW-Altiarchaeales-1]
MVMRTIEVKKISFEVEKDKIRAIIKKIKELYDDLKVTREGNIVSVSGDLDNYKKRNMLIYILTGGKHGQNI